MLRHSGSAIFSKCNLTLKGIREVFVLAFLKVKTRQVILSPATLPTYEAWVLAQTEPFIGQAKKVKISVGQVQHDRDNKFPQKFVEVLKQRKVKPIQNAYRAPSTTAYIESFIQSISQECLDRFVIFGQKHMDHLCQEYVEFYHQDRPHQVLENELPVKLVVEQKNEPCAIIRLKDIRYRQRLSGLLESYSRKAA